MKESIPLTRAIIPGDGAGGWVQGSRSSCVTMLAHGRNGKQLLLPCCGVSHRMLVWRTKGELQENRQNVPISRRARRGFEFAAADGRLIAGACTRSAGYVRGARCHRRRAHRGALLSCTRGAVGRVSDVGASRSRGGLRREG